MREIGEAFAIAFKLLFSFDPEVYEIIFLSFKVSSIAVTISCLIGFTLGAALATIRFAGRRFVIILLNAFMGLPPVVVGLVVYLMLSRSGPLGVLGLLYTPTAMVIAQVILITPLIAALSHQILQDLQGEYDEFFRSLHLGARTRVATLLWDGRHGLIVAALAGFGRAVSEVGAVMIVGGNINHLTRMMTTAITLETSKGTLATALALGIVLIAISIAVNALAMTLRQGGRSALHA